MPRGKGQTQYKKSAKNFDNDSFDFSENKAEKDPELKIRKYDIDAEELAQTASDLAIGKINQEMEDAKAELERRQKISAKNRAVRAAGRSFEEAILRACAVYKENGTAMINKVPEARRVVGRTGGRSSMMLCVNARKADPDFQGSVSPGGKCIVFDAKHTDKDRIVSTALTDYQREILEAHFACGADCFVCVSFNLSQFHLIPYGVWRNMKEVFGRQYIMPEDEQIAPYSVPFSATVGKDGSPVLTVWFLGKPADIPETIPESDQAEDAEESVSVE